ncbi:hypothetical protein CC80DRAFT_493490 [Byssothecium circinans]|uniref:LigT-like protein n=1 Tax=Byssothecium circinans TaxID=147558 RepID=A0A6A5TSQ3_9PLEO|nr:hypothetical protein CC80DRAFT_493490 [Byssothecium circinans]
MAGQLASHLSHKSALALLLPPAVSAPIEAIRREHDKHFKRWPPHINLIYPFLASPSEPQVDLAQGSESPALKQDIQRRIKEAVRHVEPFHLSLSADPPGIFSHSKRSKTVWLGPSTHLVRELQAVLQNEFSECDADKRPYTPHLSIGQAHSDAGAQSLASEITKHVSGFTMSQPTIDWYVDQVYVIERKGFHDRFKIVGAIKLGKEE